MGENLPARRRTLAGGDHAVCEKELPHAKQALTRQRLALGVNLTGENGVLARHPVVVPLVQRVRVVATDFFHRLHGKPRQLQLPNVPVQGSGGIGTGENVLVHEETPGDVLPVGALAQTGDLHEERPLGLGGHALANLLKVRVDEIVEADMFCHFNRCDFVKGTIRRNVTVVHVQDFRVLAAFGPGRVVAVLLALRGERNTRRLRAVFARGVAHQSAPPATDVKKRLVLLELKLVAYRLVLVELCLLEGAVGGGSMVISVVRVKQRDFLEDAGGVVHGVTHEGVKESVTTIVMFFDFFRRRLDVLHGGVAVAKTAANGNELGEEPEDLAHGHLVVDELVAVLVQAHKAVAALAVLGERNVSVDKKFVKLAHGNLAEFVQGAKLVCIGPLKHEVLLGVIALVTAVVPEVVHEVHEDRRSGHPCQCLEAQTLRDFVAPRGEDIVASRGEGRLEVVRSVGKGADEGDQERDEHDEDNRRVGPPGGHL